MSLEEIQGKYGEGKELNCDGTSKKDEAFDELCALVEALYVRTFTIKSFSHTLYSRM